MRRADRAGRPRRRRGAAAGQRGFTLIELMVALLVSSLLVGMILAIFMRMSIAYRGQRQIAEVQSKLSAARARIEIDAKHAGLAMPQGFTTISTAAGFRLSPLQVGNRSDGPDELGFYYADTSVRAVVTGGPCTAVQCDALTDTTGFAAGDLVVASTPQTPVASPYPATDAEIATYEACVLQIATQSPTQLTFATSGLWGNSTNSHCVPPAVGTTFYKFVAHSWRIDPARPELGVLQMSPTGDLVGANDWQDQAFGFTDLQVAMRFYEPGDLTDTGDPDLDPERDWYSAGVQETNTAPRVPDPANPVPIQISISLVARTEHDVEGVASAATPNLTVSGNSANNTIGDHAAVSLPSTDPALTGNRVFRYTTFQVDLRNLGVGR